MRNGGSLRVTIEPCLENSLPPLFSPSGDEFLTIDEPGSPLERYRYPPAVLLGICECPFAEDEFGTPPPPLHDSRALARSINGRIAVVDTPSMRVVDALALAAHEP